LTVICAPHVLLFQLGYNDVLMFVAIFTSADRSAVKLSLQSVTNPYFYTENEDFDTGPLKFYLQGETDVQGSPVVKVSHRSTSFLPFDSQIRRFQCFGGIFNVKIHFISQHRLYVFQCCSYRVLSIYDSHDTSDDPNVGKMRDWGVVFSAYSAIVPCSRVSYCFVVNFPRGFSKLT